MTPSCPDCKRSAMRDAVLICTWFGCKTSPLTAQDCTDFEREQGADVVESKAHRVWFDNHGRGD